MTDHKVFHIYLQDLFSAASAWLNGDKAGFDVIYQDISEAKRTPHVIAAAVVTSARDATAIGEILGDDAWVVLEEIIASTEEGCRNLKPEDFEGLGAGAFEDAVAHDERVIRVLKLTQGYLAPDTTVDRLPRSLVAEIAQDEGAWLDAAVGHCVAMLTMRASLSGEDPQEIVQRACLSIASARISQEMRTPGADTEPGTTT